MKVAVCVLTYRRPDGLSRLIHGLDALAFTNDAPELRIIVVDNDPGAGARELCTQLGESVRWPLEYVHEPRPGIAHARNAALDHAQHSEFIAFIDDDEVPEPGWLAALLDTQSKYNADVVGGPVLPRFVQPPPHWAVRGRFFEYLRYPTGTPRPYVFTGNVLFRSALLRELDLRFDPAWGLTGGEDRHFFQRIGRAGRSIVWCDEALAYEWVPADRVRTKWVLRRAYSYGNGAANIDAVLRPGAGTRAKLLLIGLYRIAKGVFFLPLTWPFGRHHTVTYLRHMWYGAGMLAGLLGRHYAEYADPHASAR